VSGPAGPIEEPAVPVERRAWRSTQGLLPLLVVLLITTAFLPVLRADFVSWDDDENFLKNPHYRGLGWAQLKWMFTTAPMGAYIPLSWVTLGADYLLWGMNPAGYHLTNLVLHVLNALAAYWLAQRLLRLALPTAEGPGLRVAAAVTALLFGLHPLRVESVAWVTERRDVLCGLFYFLALIAYLKAWEQRRADGRLGRSWYWGCFGLFTLALLAKPMAVSLPVILLLLDVYPLRRLSAATRESGAISAWRVVLEKTPFALLSAAMSLVTIIEFTRVGSLQPVERLGVLDRLALTVYPLVFYLWKTLVPTGLSPLYERPPRIAPFAPQFVACAALLLVLATAVLARRKRWPGVAAVGAAYLLLLLPVVGIMPQGHQLAADRHTYLASVGLALLAGAGVWWASQAGAGRRRAVTATALAVLVCAVLATLGTLTWRQARVWHDSESLWRHALRVSPSAVGHNNLGLLLAKRGEMMGAISQYHAALAINPELASARSNLATLLAHQGQPAQAVQELERAVSAKPQAAEVHYNLANTLAQQGRLAEAVERYQEALRLNPDLLEAHNNLGIILATEGRYTKAGWHFEQVLRLQPGSAQTHNNLGLVYAHQGDLDRAIQQFREAIRLKPDYREAREHLRLALGLQARRPR